MGDRSRRRGWHVQKAWCRKDPERCEKSCCKRCTASKGGLAQVRLVWKAGNQVQVGGNAMLVPSRVMGAKDTDLVITCRKKVSEIKRLRQGREREQSWTAALYGATFI